MSPLTTGKSSVTKRTVVVGSHKTGVALEEPFWVALKEIAAAENLTLRKLVTLIDSDRQSENLSSAIRLYVLGHYRRLAAVGDMAKRP